MIIKKSRINSVDKYFANIAEDKEVCLCRSTASYYCDGFLGKLRS